MISYLLVALVVVLFFLPNWMRSLFRRSGLASTNSQLILLFGFELCLAFSIFLTFFASWFSYWVALIFVAPMVTGLILTDTFWTSPLTPQGLCFLAILLILPLLVFLRVGLISVRDAHQVCKEQLDRVKKRYTLGALWVGF